jgi:hypothetical protein
MVSGKIRRDALLRARCGPQIAVHLACWRTRTDAQGRPADLSLYIEAELHHVAILDDIFFSFDP